MGIKKLVTMTVEVEIEIELSETFNNLTPELIKDINACGYDISNSDELYVAAAKLVLNGGQDSAWDVFGLVTPCWNKGRGSIPDESTFFDRRELYVEDYSVAAIAGGCEVSKVLYGLIGNKIAVVDADTSVKAKKQCFKEKCTTVIVAEKSAELMDAFANGDPVTMDMFKGVEL